MKNMVEIFEKIHDCQKEIYRFMKANLSFSKKLDKISFKPVDVSFFEKLKEISKANRNNNLTLYRYRSFNEYTLNEIMNCHVYLSKVKDFDDTFDSMYSADPLTVMAAKLSRRIAKEYGKPNDEYKEAINPTNILADTILRIACFSETKDNVPMWYYYADKYRGMCIEYEFKKDAEVALYKVMYGNTKNKVDPELRLESVIQNTLIKNKDWAYEKEWRIINIVADEFQEDMTITAIYFGHETPKEYIDLLTTWISTNKKNIKLYQMEKDVLGTFEPKLLN